MNKRGMLIVLSGPSGSGKGTIIKSLLHKQPDTILSISVTTRDPRPGEMEGVHYFFRTRAEFERMIEEKSCWNTPNTMAITTARRRIPLRNGWMKAKM